MFIEPKITRVTLRLPWYIMASYKKCVFFFKVLFCPQVLLGYSLYLAIWFYGGLCFACALASFLLPIETKGRAMPVSQTFNDRRQYINPNYIGAILSSLGRNIIITRLSSSYFASQFFPHPTFECTFEGFFLVFSRSW